MWYSLGDDTFPKRMFAVFLIDTVFLWNWFHFEVGCGMAAAALLDRFPISRGIPCGMRFTNLRVLTMCLIVLWAVVGTVPRCSSRYRSHDIKTCMFYC